jgi:hypothetical protein
VAPELVLEDTARGLQVHYAGRRLYGPRPADDAARRVTANPIAPGSVIMWPSPVVWHGWRELAARIHDSVVIAMESDPILFELSRRYLPADEPRLVLIRATPQEGIRALRAFGEHRVRRVVEISTTASARLHRNAYRLVAEVVEREIRVFWQNRMTLAAMGRLWIRNAIANLPELTAGRPTPQLRGPTVVCGAGPSLDAAVGAIHDARDLVTLVAVDTALPILAGHGVVPDIVVALEAQIANLYDFLGMGSRSYHLIADLTSSPSVAHLHRYVSWTMTRFAPFTLVDRLAGLLRGGSPLPPLGSVGVAAVSLAMAMGASPIICSGLDFAVLPGTTHARGAPSYLAAMGRANRLHPVPDPAMGARLMLAPGVAGHVRTTLVLKSYADELAAIVGAREDVFVVSPFGLPYGARSVAAGDLAAVVERAGRRGPTGRRGPIWRRTTGGTTGALATSELVRFVRQELERLQRYVSQSDRDPDEPLPPELDYLVCETSDRITSFAGSVTTLLPDRETRIRLRIASQYYMERWETTLRILERRAL